ncbi:NfeD family protein [Magnetovibrio sp. PR-2]|uniref:NfeD family protein n=1 Tax=Magnetovibrio sp. PR-2 TaxID=3120356 RepID=UPI002FCDF64E
MNVFDEVTFWHWLIAGVVLLILEMFAPGVVFMWLGLAALLTGVVSWLSPDMAMEWQLIVFAVLSVISVVAGRMYLKKRPLQTDHPTLNQRGQQYVGRHFTLEEPIEGGFGKIKVDDSTWKVAGDDMAAGTKVEVVAAEGVILKVESRG